MEVDGWECLLKSDDFKSELNRVNIFVASHHGRENGYCKEIFDICKPDVIIFSDSEIKYAIQEMASTYYNHAQGTEYGGKMRHILSTRKDGDIIFDHNYFE